jgi:hypothetical protein
VPLSVAIGRLIYVMLNYVTASLDEFSACRHHYLRAGSSSTSN